MSKLFQQRRYRILLTKLLTSVQVYKIVDAVALAMPGKDDPDQWSITLAQLKAVDDTFHGIHSDIEQKVYQRLKWSYSALPDDKLKSCFLYLAAFRNSTQLEDIIEMWIAEELVEGGGQHYLFDKGYSFMNALRDRCLIQSASNDRSGRILLVTVHDVLCDLAKRIGEKEQNCLFRVAQKLQNFPVEEISDHKRIFLLYNQIARLPTHFTCPNLVTLALSRNPLEWIPESFLHNLSSLKVLDLRRTSIKHLPTSLSRLKHLVFLDLSFTEIEELDEGIADLSGLQFLHLGYCRELRSLPSRLTELKCLTTLNLFQCMKLSVFPSGISQLTSLERLHIWGSKVSVGDGLESEEICWEDLQKLGRLRDVSVHIKSPISEGVISN